MGYAIDEIKSKEKNRKKVDERYLRQLIHLGVVFYFCLGFFAMFLSIAIFIIRSYPTNIAIGIPGIIIGLVSFTHACYLLVKQERVFDEYTGTKGGKNGRSK